MSRVGPIDIDLARARLMAAVKTGLTPLLKGRSFQKTRLLWQRRLGQTTQLIEIQLAKGFSLNGMLLAAITRVVEILDRIDGPKGLLWRVRTRSPRQ
jgi:hypothetical protein